MTRTAHLAGGGGTVVNNDVLAGVVQALLDRGPQTSSNLESSPS